SEILVISINHTKRCEPKTSGGCHPERALKTKSINIVVKKKTRSYYAAYQNELVRQMETSNTNNNDNNDNQTTAIETSHEFFSDVSYNFDEDKKIEHRRNEIMDLGPSSEFVLWHTDEDDYEQVLKEMFESIDKLIPEQRLIFGFIFFRNKSRWYCT
ncbi:18121_t:CDS:2, partial [Gigaspora rosea]